MALEWPAHDPNEILDYTVDWTKLGLGDDTIATSNFSLTVAAGLVINSQSASTNTATVWLSGGTDGLVGQILNRVTTAGGRTIDQTILLPISSR